MLTYGATLRNRPEHDVRTPAYRTIAAVLNTLDEQGKYAVLELVKREFPKAWPMEGDDE
jgi:hypothetical protein